jgi:hypothetical protein
MDVVLPWWRVPRTAVIVGVVVAVIALVVGTYAGLRSPWGAKHAQVLTGVAMLADPDGDLVSFQADNGDTLGFHSNGIVWEAGNEAGWGSPPCIRKALAKTLSRGRLGEMPLRTDFSASDFDYSAGLWTRS